MSSAGGDRLGHESAALQRGALTKIYGLDGRESETRLFGHAHAGKGVISDDVAPCYERCAILPT